MPKSKKEATALIAEKMPDEEDVLRRLYRAEQDVLGYGYDITADQGGTDKSVWIVSKLSTSPMGASNNDSSSYIVDDNSCTCPDFEKARGNLCKHRLAIMILEEMQID